MSSQSCPTSLLHDPHTSQLLKVDPRPMGETCLLCEAIHYIVLHCSDVQNSDFIEHLRDMTFCNGIPWTVSSTTLYIAWKLLTTTRTLKSHAVEHVGWWREYLISTSRCLVENISRHSLCDYSASLESSWSWSNQTSEVLLALRADQEVSLAKAGPNAESCES